MSIDTGSSVIAVAVFQKTDNLTGYVLLKEDFTRQKTLIQANIKGLEPNRSYAWHIHEAGDLRKPSCNSACAHYNPFNMSHGGIDSFERHVGDLGNLHTNSFGESRTRVWLASVKLRGIYSVIGRSVVIHENVDDLGLGNTQESLTTGSAGRRIACGVIGYAANSNLYF